MSVLTDLINGVSDLAVSMGQAVARRVRFDLPQTLSNDEKAQGQANLGVNTRYFSIRNLLSITDAAQNNAIIQALLDQGYIVVLPNDGQVYPIQATLQIGDGDADSVSTRSGGLVGAGGATPYGALSTYLKWTGAIGSQTPALATPFIRVNGMVYGLVIDGVGLNCDFKCAGIEILGMRASEVSRNSISAFIGFGLKIADRAGLNGQQIIQNKVSYNIAETGGDQANHPVNGARGLWLDGILSEIDDPWLNVFEGNRWAIVKATNSYAGYLAFCDNNLFLRDHFVWDSSGKGVGSYGLCFDSTNNDHYPSGNHFVSPSISDTLVIEGGSTHIGPQYFSCFGTYDNETIPTHPSLRGFTDTGLVFNGGIKPAEADIQGSAWSPFTPTLSAAAGTITSASAGARYKKIGRTVFLRVSVSAPNIGTATTALFIENLPAEIAPQGQNAAQALNNTALAPLYAVMTSSPSRLTVRTAAGAFPLANGESLTLNITYEAAS